MSRVKLLFMTSARSEYGTAKSLLRLISSNRNYDFKVFPFGLHLKEEFGYTLTEIIEDGFNIEGPLDSYTVGSEKSKEFTDTITSIVEYFKFNELPDLVFIIGDRLEMYACALACHFMNIPILHSGGGAITKGAFDNIYRYNITNLATIHFATSKGNYENLLQLPSITSDNVYNVGSVAIDNIIRFKKTPVSVSDKVPGLIQNNYVLMTFHTATKSTEDIAGMMDYSINFFSDQGYQVLITAPNNDIGYEKIMDIIYKWRSQDNIYYIENLGATYYYAALNDCRLVCGNSSSGLIEAPYFNKPVVNIGTRQEGRESDPAVFNVEAVAESLSKIYNYILTKVFEVPCSNVFGTGNSSVKVMDILDMYFNKLK